MNDEIREILARLSRYVITPDVRHDFDDLLDYITNLQQENEEWAMIFDTFSKRPYAHKYLEEKRKELGNDKIIGLDSEMIYKDYYDYKSRVEKAIEILHNLNDTLPLDLILSEIEHSENILQNGSDASVKD